MASRGDTRERILAGAALVLARVPYAQARVEDALQASGVSRRTFYKHFSGLDDVLVGLYEMATQRLLATMVDAASRKPGFAAVTAGLDAYLDAHLEHGPVLKVLVEQAIRSDSPIWAARWAFREALVDIIDQAVRAGGGRPQPKMLYAGLVSALEGVSLELLHETPTPRKVAEAKRVMRTLLTRCLFPAKSV